MFRAIALFAFSLALLAPQEASAYRVMTYNVLNYSGGRVSELQTVINAAEPDLIVLQEVISFSDAVTFLTNVLNGAGGPGGFTLGAFTSDGSLTNNAIYYRSALFTFGGIGDHIDLNTSPRDVDRWKLGLVGYTGPASEIYIYGMHLKAGSSGSDMAQRATAATAVRNNTNALPAGSNFILTGDFNLQTSSESAYTQFIGVQGNNNGRAFDPINSPGSWSNNSGFAAIHTQSPHQNNPGAPPGATPGGLDDRFDFQLVSSSLNDGEGYSYVPGSYRAFGNDGLHFNDDINDPPTIPEGAVVANALHGASDHLPVIADYQVPARIGFDPAVNFGSVIVGGSATATLNVFNSGNVALFGHVDDLDYSLAPPAGFTVGSGPFSAIAGSPGINHLITMDASVAGNQFGLLTISSDAYDLPTVQVSLSGLVLRRADASFEANSAVTSINLDLGAHQPGMFPGASFDIHNRDFDVLQALLDVYTFTLIGSNDFQLQGGFNPTLVGATPLTQTFDFVGATPGVYTALASFDVRDDPSVAGGLPLPSLIVNLTATVLAGGDCNNNGVPDDQDISQGTSADTNMNGVPDECECPTPFIRGEVNGDGMVDIGDAVYLLAFLFSNGPEPMPVAAGDVNGDGMTDVADAVYLLAYQFSNGPEPPAPFPTIGCP